ncbi:Glutathione S-transferase, N-terminal [Penicillium expansum]|uniref:Glutathione S-transferase, N-terminal n=1 Tax=Penicillium expansum TaxID=27334 RepID=A0A0A2JT42_PENEN|nr:Glutathione S-transferase, N-terminal [Penicillium expansum]KGO57818.1 Glutathione S-transferase, N-terminal [Penicillium expansum]
MAVKQKVLLLGATGETGTSILKGLQESGNFDIEVLVRPASVNKPSVQRIQEQGIKIWSIDLNESSDLISAFSGVDVLISAIGPQDVMQQKKLLEAAKLAGIKRVVPCAFITVAPPHGAMLLRDEKEEVYNDIKLLGIPYTIIDVGYWYQISFPIVPSGRVDYASAFPNNTIHGDGTVPNILTDLRDIGRFVACIICDDRTLNKYVYTYGDVLSENEIYRIAEDLSGEKIESTPMSIEQIKDGAVQAQAAFSQDPQDPMKRMFLYLAQYRFSKYVRKDNEPAYADYLGYLNARSLYPEFTPTSFREFFAEALAGKVSKVLAYRTNVNSRGELPALRISDQFVLTEITAICEYFDEVAKGGKSLFGETALERAETRMWLRRMDMEIAQQVIDWFRNDPGTIDFYKGNRIPVPEARVIQKVTINQFLNRLDDELEEKSSSMGTFARAIERGGLLEENGRARKEQSGLVKFPYGIAINLK